MVSVGKRADVKVRPPKRACSRRCWAVDYRSGRASVGPRRAQREDEHLVCTQSRQQTPSTQVSREAEIDSSGTVVDKMVHECFDAGTRRLHRRSGMAGVTSWVPRVLCTLAIWY